MADHDNAHESLQLSILRASSEADQRDASSLTAGSLRTGSNAQLPTCPFAAAMEVSRSAFSWSSPAPVPEPANMPDTAAPSAVRTQVRWTSALHKLKVKSGKPPAGDPSRADVRSRATSWSRAGASMSEHRGRVRLRRLEDLDRDEWSQKEIKRRAATATVLATTLKQLDGTIPSTSPATKHHGIMEFGMEFYQELFSQHPEMQLLFSNKPLDHLATATISMILGIVRLQKITSPRLMASAVEELALMHIEYGVQPTRHPEPFKTALLRSMRRVLCIRGFQWTKSASQAWSEATDEALALLMDGIVTMQPKVKLVQQSWMDMCEGIKDMDFNSKQDENSSFYGVSLKVKAANKFMSLQSSQRNSGRPGPLGGSERRLNKFTTLATSLRSLQPSRSSTGVRSDSNTGAPAPKPATSGLKSWVSTARSKNGSAKSSKYSAWGTTSLNQSDAASEYDLGKEKLGQAFVAIFAGHNTWIVERWNYGANGKAMGRQMGEMLETIVKCATRPGMLKHKLRVLAWKHTQMGVTPEMFDDFEAALFTLLSKVLGSMCKWSTESEEAWRWLWAIVRNSFCSHMKSASRMIGKIERTWAVVANRDDFSELFYKQLFATSPQIQRLFTKPQATQNTMLMTAMSMLVSSVNNPDAVREEIRAVAMRHIKYSLSPEDFEVFGKVLVAALREAVGEQSWDEETQGAWTDIFEMISEVFMQVMAPGKNLLAQALLSGSGKKLQAALDNVPRGERIKAALEIRVDSKVLSPILLSILEGHSNQTEMLIKDLLSIRADRSTYYYGRADLWRASPWLLATLVDRLPKALPTLLDGHLWCSRFVENGTRRVNYYIQELYGDPGLSDYGIVHNTPLAILVHRLPMSELDVFTHPVVRYLVDLKWQLFARSVFAGSQAIHLTHVALYTAFLHVSEGDAPAWVSLGLGCAVAAVALTRLVFVLWRVATQAISGSGVDVLGGRLQIPFALLDIYLVLCMVGCVLCLAVFAFTWVADPFGWGALVGLPGADTPASLGQLQAWSTLAAFTMGTMWIQTTEVFKTNTQLSALSYALAAVLSDVMMYMAVMALWVVGFGLTMYWLFVSVNLQELEELSVQEAGNLPEELLGGSGLPNALGLIYYLFLAVIGLAETQPIIEGTSWLIRVVFLLCVLATAVVLLNLLVATMVTTYDTLQRSCEDLAYKCRADLVLRAEERLPASRRKAIFDSLELQQPCPFDEGDMGPTGGVQVREHIDNLTHPAFDILDRVHRYSGTVHPKEPWKADDLQSGPTTVKRGRGEASEGVMQRLDALEALLNSQVTFLQQHLGTSEKDEVVSNEEEGTRTSLDVSEEEEKDDMLNRFLMEGEDVVEAGDVLEPPTGPQSAFKDLRDVTPAELQLHNGGKDRRDSSPSDVQQDIGSKGLMSVSPAELQQHIGDASSCWVAVSGKVYDVTGLLDFHPGGRQLLLAASGRDATQLFESSHTGPSRTAALGLLKSVPVIGEYR